MIGQRGPNLVMSFLKVKAKRKPGLMFKNDAFCEINAHLSLCRSSGIEALIIS